MPRPWWSASGLLWPALPWKTPNLESHCRRRVHRRPRLRARRHRVRRPRRRVRCRRIRRRQARRRCRVCRRRAVHRRRGVRPRHRVPRPGGGLRRRPLGGRGRVMPDQYF